MLLAAMLTGCTPGLIESLLGSSRAVTPVYFIRAEGLEPPSAGDLPRVFKPQGLFATGPNADAGLQVFTFSVVLATDDPARVEMRLSDARGGPRSTLERIAAPIGDGAAPAANLGDAATVKLATGGVFWYERPGDVALEHRFGVALRAAALTPFTRLEFFAAEGADGAPLSVDSIELAPDFFYVAVIGDSVLWGNGLNDRDKISARVAREIDESLGRRAIVQLLAQSGATIIPGPNDGVCNASCSGEVPFIPTSITTQLGQIERPDLIELVIMDGCANDISIPTILAPQTTDAELEALSSEFCNTAMTGLLRQVRTVVPSATIVVTGYYPLVSAASSSLALRAWELTRGAISSDGDGIMSLVDELTQQSSFFKAVTTADLEAVVAAAQAADPGLKIAYAEPVFGPNNTAFASDAWLWGVTDENTLFEDLNLIQTLNLDLFPEDPVQTVRVQLCFDPANSLTLLDCLYASVGHPNPQGAAAYAERVIEQLRVLGVLPPAP